MRKLPLIVAAVAIILILSVMAASGGVRTQEVQVMDGSDMVVGESYTLELEENGSTGYSWSFTESDGYEVSVEHVYDDSKGLVGAPGKCVVTITALKEGDYIFGGKYIGPTGKLGSEFEMQLHISGAD